MSEIEKLAQEWAKEDNYEEIRIRKTSSNQNGIGIVYNNPRGNDKKAMDDYMEEMSDVLRRRFGNDLAGWDMASSYTIIK